MHNATQEDQSDQSPKTLDQQAIGQVAVVATACRSVAGTRPENEDHAGAMEVQVGGSSVALVAVMDGMGGHGHGEMAARVVCRSSLCEVVLSAADYVFEPEVCLKRMLLNAQKKLATEILDKDANRGAGTTACVALLHEGVLHVLNVGDSRAYIVRDGEARQLTRDDSYVQDLVDQGVLTPEQAERHPCANQITKAVCLVDELSDVPVSRQEVRPGDLVLVCSDGLWKVGSDVFGPAYAWLAGDRERACTLQDLAEGLVSEALRLGSDDNVSVALIQCGVGDHDQDAQRIVSCGEEV